MRKKQQNILKIKIVSQSDGVTVKISISVNKRRSKVSNYFEALQIKTAEAS